METEAKYETGRESVSSALATLKDATLRVLYNEHRNGQKGYLRLGEIQEQLGIPRVEKARHKHSLVHGILIQLWGDGTADHTGRDQWEIKKEGIAMIQGRHAS